MQRKASATREGKLENLTKIETGKKSSNSQPRVTLNQPADNTEDEDILNDMDIIPGGSTYLNNHQSQPLSVIGSDLNMQAKPRNGQSQQQMNPKNGGGQKKLFKNNPTILNGANGEPEDPDINSASQFMGKRNS